MSVQFQPVQAPPEQPPRVRAGSFASVLQLLQAAGVATPIHDPRLVVFGAAHAVTALEVSAYRPDRTAQRLAELDAGAGPAAAAAQSAGVGVRAVDLTGLPSGRIDRQDALAPVDLEAAVQAGVDAADAAVDSGADLLIGAVCSVGASTPAAVLVAAITGLEPVDATSRGSGISDAAWIRKAAAVRDALYRVRIAGTDAVTLLRTAGGADLAALTAFLAQAAVRRTPVLIDDVPSTVCAVLAHRLAPGADGYVVAAAVTAERGHRRLLEVLGREPLSSFTLPMGSGIGSLLMVPVLRAAAAAADYPDSDRVPDALDSWDPDLF